MGPFFKKLSNCIKFLDSLSIILDFIEFIFFSIIFLGNSNKIAFPFFFKLFFCFNLLFFSCNFNVNVSTIFFVCEYNFRNIFFVLNINLRLSLKIHLAFFFNLVSSHRIYRNKKKIELSIFFFLLLFL